MDYRELMEMRRSVGTFDPNVIISMKDLREIYETAKLTPSSFNTQPWRVIVALSPECKEALKKAAMNQPKVSEASAVLILLGNKEQHLESDDTFNDWVQKGYVPRQHLPAYKETARKLYDPPRDVLYAARNVGLFAMNLMLSALDRGWDTHPMDGFDPDAVRALFDLPPKYEPVMLIAIGKKKPDASLRPRALRRSFDQVFVVK